MKAWRGATRHVLEDWINALPDAVLHHMFGLLLADSGARPALMPPLEVNVLPSSLWTMVEMIGALPEAFFLFCYLTVSKF